MTIGRAAALTILVVLGYPATTRASFLVDFDDVAAPTRIGEIIPGGPLGPVYSRFGVTFDGGLVLNDPRYGGVGAGATSPNVYVTSDQNPLVDGTRLPGSITATVSVPVFGIGLFLVNGSGSRGTFTLTAFSEDDTILARQSITLGVSSLLDRTGRLTVLSPTAIARFTVTTDRVALDRSFAIDSVMFASPSVVVPEPSSLLMVAIGGSAWIGSRGRGRRRGAQDRGPAAPLT